MGTQLLALQDANFRALGFTIRIFCMIAILHLVAIVHMNLHLVAQWHIVELFQYEKHAITADNIVSSYFGFTAIILLRNAYRKHRWVRDCNEGDTAVVRCIAYRCRVRLSLVQVPQVIDSQGEMSERMTQMRLVPSNHVYDSDDMFLQCFISASRIRNSFATNVWNQIGLYLVGATALGLMIAAFSFNQERTSMCFCRYRPRLLAGSSVAFSWVCISGNCFSKWLHHSISYSCGHILQ